ncbi:MAG: hypothetical protein JRJ29_15150 [Deltaproteobacteria bacterium]|nr:hypothetical protein [Deltaproteobacteria bacterium]
MTDITERLEYTASDDPFYDFCLWEYTPVCSWENKFRSANLLFHSFEMMNVSENMFALVQAIRERFGPLRTVWGLKKMGDEISWEFYFYDYRRRERERSITRLLDAVGPLVNCRIRPDENIHYFMFSIDVSDELVSGNRALEEIHMYIGNPGSTVSSGICYSLTEHGTRLENFYFFFDAKRQMEEILAKAACSAHIDTTRINIPQILWPEMRGCEVIVIANKQENDAVYFSRININQLMCFLKKMAYPPKIVSFIEENRFRLDHLLYDVGFDYRMEDDDLRILKSGYYGIF